MAFRADEAMTTGYERALEYLVNRNIRHAERERSKNKLLDMIEELGPVIECYPSWHPLVSCQAPGASPEWPRVTPSRHHGYDGIDHNVFFTHGFVTCPYTDGEEVLDAVKNLPAHPAAHINAERIEDALLYNDNTNPILVRCEWWKNVPSWDRTIPKSLAVPLILEQELPNWRNSHYAETWETMRPYFLGHPHGSRSSLFLTQETGQAIKNIWNALINTGMYGSIRV